MTHRFRMFAISTAVSAIAAGALTGCGSRVDAAASEPALGPIPVVDGYDDIAFPLDPYHLTADQRGTLSRAADLLTAECMKGFGFDHPVLEPAGAELRDRAIGVVSSEEAAAHGYRNRAGERAAAENDANRAKAQVSGTAAAVLAGTGQTQYGGKAVPDGGCSGEARRGLGMERGGSAEPGTENFLVTLDARSSDLAEADSRLKTAFGRWQDCMIEAGYHYMTPWGPNDDPAFRSEKVSAAEIATAKADVACRNRHDVSGTWVAVRSAYQEQLIEEHAVGLAQHREIKAKQLARATEVIAAHRS